MSPFDDAGEHLAVGLRGGRRHGHGQDYSPYALCVASACEVGAGGSCGSGLTAKRFEAFGRAKMGAKGYQPSGWQSG